MGCPLAKNNGVSLRERSIYEIYYKNKYNRFQSFAIPNFGILMFQSPLHQHFEIVFLHIFNRECIVHAIYEKHYIAANYI